jgi:hypothetical protein
MKQCGVGRHYYWRQRRQRRIRGRICCSGRAWGRLVVGEDLVDAESHVGKLITISDGGGLQHAKTYQERRLDWVASGTDDAPSTQEDGRGDGHTDKNSIYVADLREGGDAPQKVDGGRDDGCGGDEEADLCNVSLTHILGPMRRTIQLSPRSLLTTHRVIWPAAWMTNKLQKPSAIWNTGVLYRSVLSHAPIEALCRRPSLPNIHSFTVLKSDLLPPNVFAAQPALLVASMENLFRLQINSVGIASHCAHATMLHSAHLNLDVSGVARRRTE